MAQTDFGTTLKSLRTQAGMSQEELAAKAQVSRASVQNWEGGRRLPRRAESRRLAAALGISTDDLRTHQGETGVEPEEIRDALEAAMNLDDPEEMRAALQELLSRMPPAPED